jgi:2-polyprenyl-6-methoxyphenol hydroxylase-like FAD-dependent oxidoreductase
VQEQRWLIAFDQEWLLIHRAHLHEALKDKALASGQGMPVILHTSSKVVEVDPHAATVTLENGTTFQGDIVVGADGVHSATRRHVAVEDVKPFSSSRNAFRFMVPRKEVLDDPETADLVRTNGTVHMWHSCDSKVVIYPCVNNEVLNFVCIHPDTLTNASISQGWSQGVGKDTLLDAYKDYDPGVVKILNKADPETLKIWPLLDMETLPQWINDRLVLMGDAAHPFLPYRASGGAMAIEDGLSLAAMLSGDVNKDNIPTRLKLYEEARQKRVHQIQYYTRESGRRHVGGDEGNERPNNLKCTQP